MKIRWGRIWFWIVGWSLLLNLCACAQGTKVYQLNELEWRQFDAWVDGRRLTFRFPVDSRPQTQFAFNPAPTADRYTKGIDIIGMQVGLDIGWRIVSTDYKFALGLDPVRSAEIGQARSARELAASLDRHFNESARKAYRLLLKRAEQQVVRLGDREWVRIRYLRNNDAAIVDHDDYQSLWTEQYLLGFEIRYGDGLGGDPAAIERLRSLGEEILASLRIH